MLIKNRLMEYVKCIDMDTEGQIWVSLTFLVIFKLGGVYIPPEDSPYFQQANIVKDRLKHVKPKANSLSIVNNMVI